MANATQVLREHNGNSHSAVTYTDGCPTSNLSEWHMQFNIPDLQSFSQHVKNAVNTGVITARARREINQVLRTYMTAYTIFPTSEQYTTICKKLIEKYPSLKDTEGTTKYSFVNWLVHCLFLYRVHGRRNKLKKERIKLIDRLKATCKVCSKK